MVDYIKYISILISILIAFIWSTILILDAHACAVPGTKIYDPLIKAAVEKHWPADHHDEWCSLKAQLYAESGLRPDVCSPVGACGIAQFVPATAKEWKVDRFDPASSIEGAAAYMEWEMARWPHAPSFKCMWELALASYDWGIGHMRRAFRDNKIKVQCWNREIMKHAPLETIHYVKKIETLLIEEQ